MENLEPAPAVSSVMLDAGVDLRDVQIAARHADPRTTMRYDRVKDDGWADGNQITATYNLKRKPVSLKQTLFRRLPNPYVSTGYSYAQAPGDGAWSSNDMDGAKIVGINPDKTAAITLFNGDGYHAIYIASMPEYNGGTQDQQFLYNAIIYPNKG